MSQIFIKYPQLNNLRSLVPDSLIEEEIGSRADEFERYFAEAKSLIPTVNLNKVFPDDLEKESIHLENFLGHWGNVSIEELCKICLIVKWLKPNRILEMGTYNGMTTLQMALNAPKKCQTFTLDLEPGSAAQLPLSKIDELHTNHFQTKFNTQTGSYFQGRSELGIKQLWGDTATFDYSTLGGAVDLVFVDAAHDYKNKRCDCENAFKLLSENGVILWHNYADVCNPDVTRCLAEYAQTHAIFHLRNTNLAVYYRGKTS
jgi:predicted O-methyltransferase YrrM